MRLLITGQIKYILPLFLLLLRLASKGAPIGVNECNFTIGDYLLLPSDYLGHGGLNSDGWFFRSNRLHKSKLQFRLGRALKSCLRSNRSAVHKYHGEGIKIWIFSSSVTIIIIKPPSVIKSNNNRSVAAKKKNKWGGVWEIHVKATRILGF